MCLYLVNSQYKSIDEVEKLLNSNITEKDIIAIKDNRKEILKQLKLIELQAEIDALGI